MQRFWSILDSTWGQLWSPPTAPTPSNPPLAIEDGNPAPLLAIEDGDPHAADGQASLVSEPVGPFDPYLGAWSSDEDGEGDDDVTPSAPPPPQQVSVETRSVENLCTDSLMASSSTDPRPTTPAEETAARLARLVLLRTA